MTDEFTFASDERTDKLVKPPELGWPPELPRSLVTLPPLHPFLRGDTMALDARSRHHLYLQLEEALGPEAASTLMEHLPPVGWADVATKRDLDALEERINLRFEASEARIDARFAAVDARFAAVDARFDVIDARFDAIDARFEAFDTQFEATENKLLAAFRGELQAALTAQGRQLAISLAGTAATLSALAFAAARLT